MVAFFTIARAQVTPSPSTMVIALGDISDITGQSQANPLRRLSKRLQQYPKHSRFRLIWGDYMGNFSTDATALYDRKTRTFKLYSNTFIGGIGNEAVSNEVKHWMFSRVSDSMIYQLDRKHQGTLDSDNGTIFDGVSFFSELGSYGAKRRDLGSCQVLSDYGKAMRRHKQQ